MVDADSFAKGLVDTVLTMAFLMIEADGAEVVRHSGTEVRAVGGFVFVFNGR